MDHRRYAVVTGTHGKPAKAVRFAVRLTPNSGRNAIEGWIPGEDGKRVLKARVAAPPHDGKANAALVALIADALDIGESKVRIVACSSSRVKLVEVDGEAEPVAARLSHAGAKA